MKILTLFLALTCTFLYLISDLYQITMAYAYWKSGKKKDHAVFDLFFRQNPFQGEFTIFAGLEESMKFLENFHYSESGEFNEFLILVQYVESYAKSIHVCQCHG